MGSAVCGHLAARYQHVYFRSVCTASQLLFLGAKRRANVKPHREREREMITPWKPTSQVAEAISVSVLLLILDMPATALLLEMRCWFPGENWQLVIG